MLASQGIDHAVRAGPDGFELLTDDADAERAERALRAYARENPAKRPAPEPIPEWGTTYAGIVGAGVIAAFHAVALRDPAWYPRGSANALAIADGELWRTVTALTLHVDLAHLVANALSSLVFVTLLCRWIGPGAGLLLTLLAGAGGNLLGAWAHGPPHVAVGASTALFGSIGLLAGLAFRLWRRRGARFGRAWLPLAGGLGLLAMLGTGGDRTDVLAHLFGLLVGSALGAAVAPLVRHVPAPRTQAALGAAASLTLAGAWALAFDLI